MISSRQAAFAAASLLSAVILMPTVTFADDKPAAADSPADNEHKKGPPGREGRDRGWQGGDRAREGGERKGPREAKPHDGNQPAMKQHGGPGEQPRPKPENFGQQPRPKPENFGQQPRPKPQNFGQQPRPDGPSFGTMNKPAAIPEAKQPAPKPPVVNTAPKNEGPDTFSKERGPNQFNAHDRGGPGQKPKNFGEQGNPPPSGEPPSGNKPERKQFGNQGSPQQGPGDRRSFDRPANAPPPPFGGASPNGAAQLPRPLSPADARKRFDNLRKARTERVEGGNVVIKEPGNRTIFKKDNRFIIQHDETERLRRVAPNARFEKGKGGTNIAVIDRPGNVRIYSETDSNGHLIRRYRRGPDGRDVIIIDNRRGRHGHGGSVGRDIAAGVGIGIGVVAGAAILNSVLDVPPPRVDIPRDRYIVDYDGASEDDVYDALSAPPVDEYSDRYTLDEIRATAALRDRMRRVDLDDINFEFGSWEVDPGEYRKLERVARAMKRVISRNPDEVFMIEGYTDAVGSPEDNLSLSDRRAESVAEVLTEEFNVPFENLVTQGYGEDYLKVPTQAPERLNRRVAVRRITPLLARGDGPPPGRPVPPPGGGRY